MAFRQHGRDMLGKFGPPFQTSSFLSPAPFSLSAQESPNMTSELKGIKLNNGFERQLKEFNERAHL